MSRYRMKDPLDVLIKDNVAYTSLQLCVQKVLKKMKLSFSQFSKMLFDALPDKLISETKKKQLRNSITNSIFTKRHLSLDKFKFIMNEVLNVEIPEKLEFDQLEKIGRGGKDLRKENFGLLTPVECLGAIRDKVGNNIWRCQCKCGNEIEVPSNNLQSGHTTSCGCHALACRTKHGMCGTPTYTSWDSMIQRCSNPKNINYVRYGGRGIKVCDRWRDSFDNFYEDMGTRPEGLTIDRISNDGDYEPDNCRWATRHEQDYNRSDTLRFDDGTPVGVWAAEYGLTYKNVIYHHANGRSKDEILAMYQ